jgi:hypothetical protein
MAARPPPSAVSNLSFLYGTLEEFSRSGGGSLTRNTPSVDSSDVTFETTLVNSITQPSTGALSV